MIKLTNPSSGTAQYISPRAIARIIEAGASSQWHGIRSYIKTFDGQTLECSETVEEINAALEAEWAYAQADAMMKAREE